MTTLSFVGEFQILYTTNLTQKLKKWKDGTLRFFEYNQRVQILDETGATVGDYFAAEYAALGLICEGSELRFDAHIVNIEAKIRQVAREIDGIKSKLPTVVQSVIDDYRDSSERTAFGHSQRGLGHSQRGLGPKRRRTHAVESPPPAETARAAGQNGPLRVSVPRVARSAKHGARAAASCTLTGTGLLEMPGAVTGAAGDDIPDFSRIAMARAQARSGAEPELVELTDDSTDGEVEAEEALEESSCGPWSREAFDLFAESEIAKVPVACRRCV